MSKFSSVSEDEKTESGETPEKEKATVEETSVSEGEDETPSTGGLSESKGFEDITPPEQEGYDLGEAREHADEMDGTYGEFPEFDDPVTTDWKGHVPTHLEDSFSSFISYASEFQAAYTDEDLNPEQMETELQHLTYGVIDLWESVEDEIVSYVDAVVDPLEDLVAADGVVRNLPQAEHEIEEGDRDEVTSLLEQTENVEENALERIDRAFLELSDRLSVIENVRRSIENAEEEYKRQASKIPTRGTDLPAPGEVTYQGENAVDLINSLADATYEELDRLSEYGLGRQRIGEVLSSYGVEGYSTELDAPGERVETIQNQVMAESAKSTEL